MKNILYQISLCLAIVLSQLSCKKHISKLESPYKYVLIPTGETPNDVFIEIVEDGKRIIMNKYLTKDSTLLRRKFFIKKGGAFYEKFILKDAKGDRDTLELLMLSTEKDTVFKYAYDNYDKFYNIPTKSRDYKIDIHSKKNNHFVTDKYSPYGEGALEEKFCYDKNYTILAYNFYNIKGDTLSYVSVSQSKNDINNLDTVLNPKKMKN
ncbi:hypothetical protein [Pontibacter chitinilyticus]|uniref:hypothetical protein n=1 Tax=Pontibacter chitinilyticus TaxID=2674989 RepID=UPI00321BFA36